MTYEYTVKQDGLIYEPGQDVPDMGSLVCVSAYGNIRNYEGNSVDVQKLPLYVETGSLFLAIDTGDYYKFEATTRIWNKIQNPLETDKTLSVSGGIADAKTVGDELDGKVSGSGISLYYDEERQCMAGKLEG